MNDKQDSHHLDKDGARASLTTPSFTWICIHHQSIISTWTMNRILKRAIKHLMENIPSETMGTQTTTKVPQSLIQFVADVVGFYKLKLGGKLKIVGLKNVSSVLLYCLTNNLWQNILFRCVHASLYEGPSVRRSVGPSVGPSVGRSVTRFFPNRGFWMETA